MAKQGITNIETSNTFQNWLDGTNELIDLMKTDVVTASELGDTTIGNATLLGDFKANTLIAEEMLRFNVAESKSGTNTPVTFNSPLNVTTSFVNTGTFRSSLGPRTSFASDNVTWQIGFESAISPNFVITTGSGEPRFRFESSGAFGPSSLRTGIINSVSGLIIQSTNSAANFPNSTIISSTNSSTNETFSVITASTGSNANAFNSSIMASQGSTAGGIASFVAGSLNSNTTNEISGVLTSVNSGTAARRSIVVSSAGSDTLVNGQLSSIISSSGSKTNSVMGVVLSGLNSQTNGFNSAVIASQVSTTGGNASFVLGSVNSNSTNELSGVISSSASNANGALSTVISSSESNANGERSTVISSSGSNANSQMGVILSGLNSQTNSFNSAVIASQTSSTGGNASFTLGSLNSSTTAELSGVITSLNSTANGSRSAVISSDGSQANGSRSTIISSDGSQANSVMGAIISGLNSQTNGFNSAVIASQSSSTGGNASFTLGSFESSALAELDGVISSFNSSANGRASSIIASLRGGTTGYNSSVISSQDCTSKGVASSLIASLDSETEDELSSVISSITALNKAKRSSIISSVNSNIESGRISSTIISSAGVGLNSNYAFSAASFNSSTTNGDFSSLISAVRSNANGNVDAIIASLDSNSFGLSSTIMSSELVTVVVGTQLSAVVASFNSSIGDTPSNLTQFNLLSSSSSSNIASVGRILPGTQTLPMEGATLISSRNTIANKWHTLTLGYANTGGPSTANRKIELNPVSGNITASGGFSTGNPADFAELFENKTGVKIEAGLILTQVEDGVKVANEDDDIAGVVSYSPAILANDSPYHWHGRYERDDFGNIIYESEKFAGWTGEPEECPDIMVPKECEDWNPDLPQTPRSERPTEWTPVALLGQVFVRVSQDVKDGDKIKPSNGGVGVPSSNKTGLKCMKITTPYDEEKGYAVAKCIINVQV